MKTLLAIFLLSVTTSGFSSTFAVQNYNCQFEKQELEVIDHAPMLTFNPIEKPDYISYEVDVDETNGAIAMKLINEKTGEMQFRIFPAGDIYPAVYVTDGADRNGVTTQLRLHCKE